ncbi:hypothetical protein AQUCO_00201054v1 [Aquilegia coerulea]|uniref:protein-S-isoprenylcysteine alpha-carbonyl methylesterase n=1 Tax=Aquilegia coerulea TaxID=218851 RepID=A0A2G5F600_AQUCA|nr:hypothetical protein AQUCO_00201054v1 [Aquilegia coerulea]
MIQVFSRRIHHTKQNQIINSQIFLKRTLIQSNNQYQFHILSVSKMQSQPFSSSSFSTKKDEIKPESKPTMASKRLEQEEEQQQQLTKPILSKDHSTSFSKNLKNQQRRRKVTNNGSSSGTSASRFLSRQQSFRRDVEHAAAETFLLTRLSFTLLRYLGVGYRWITKFIALTCYAMLLMPGFLQVAYYYFFSKQVHRSIVYGDQPRNRLDLYLPVNFDGPKPVVAFVTGGAWIIGNFPQGTISDMVQDVSQGITYVCNNIADYGGDPNRIYLVGQSAGAHIASCVLVEQAIKESSKGDNISWSVSQIKAYFGISGGYNILNLVDHFHGRGLYRSIFLSIMEGTESLPRFSPEVLVQDPSTKTAVSLLPRIVLLHGTSDYSIPSEASETFADALQKVGARVELKLYKGKTHTDLFLQDPLRGGKDEVLEDILSIIQAGETIAKDWEAPPIKRLVPEFMLQLARKISPF